jgi:protein O-mannosyl-transferase
MPFDDRAPEAHKPESALVVPDVLEPKIPGLIDSIRDYFLGEDPTFAVAIVPCCFLAMALFTRHPFKTNFIFDEQEALLANPYVRSIADPVSKLHWLDAFRRDFWGLPHDQSPFLHHWVNFLLHGLNGALLTLIAFRLTKDRLTAWLCGGIFVACAVLTEAVTGVVGIADVLGALGALLALMALALPLTWMPLAVFGATMFGLFSKESALVCVPLVPFAALMTAQITHPEEPLRWVRAQQRSRPWWPSYSTSSCEGVCSPPPSKAISRSKPI